MSNINSSFLLDSFQLPQNPIDEPNPSLSDFGMASFSLTNEATANTLQPIQSSPPLFGDGITFGTTLEPTAFEWSQPSASIELPSSQVQDSFSQPTLPAELFFAPSNLSSALGTENALLNTPSGVSTASTGALADDTSKSQDVESNASPTPFVASPSLAIDSAAGYSAISVDPNPDLSASLRNAQPTIDLFTGDQPLNTSLIPLATPTPTAQNTAQMSEIFDGTIIGTQNHSNINNEGGADSGTYLKPFESGATISSSTASEARPQSGVLLGTANGAQNEKTTTSAESDLLQREKEANEKSVFGNDPRVVSDIAETSIIDADTPRNPDGSVDMAWRIKLDTDKYKITVGIANFGSSGQRYSSPAGSPNIFDPRGSTTTTVSGNVVEASKKAWDAVVDSEKMGKALKTIPGLGVVEPVADLASASAGTYNDGTPYPTGVSYGAVGVKVKTELGDGKLTVSLGNSGGSTGASFADLDLPKVPINGVLTLQVDPTKGIAKALYGTPLAPVGAALDLSNRLGLQNTISYSVPISVENLANPNFEGFVLGNGSMVQNPADVVISTAREDVKREPLLNFGSKEVARYNAELQFALGSNPLDVARVSINPTTNMRNNYGSDTLALANQFYDTMVAYGGAKEGERISSVADFNNRVYDTIHRLKASGKDSEIPEFVGRLANPYGVNAGNAYIAEANAEYKGAKRVDATTAKEVQAIFNGEFQPKKTKS